jgi:Eukaryotic aspartyl protease
MNITVGNLGKSYSMLVDTYSSDFWVCAWNCSTCGCQSRTLLGTLDSSSLQVLATPWSINYGGGVASGNIAKDTVTIAGLVVPTLTFGSASYVDCFVNGDVLLCWHTINITRNLTVYWDLGIHLEILWPEPQA